jgi:cell division protein FtsB
MGCHMRSLQAVRAGIVVVVVFGMLNGGVGYAIQAQQSSTPAQASGSNQDLAGTEKAADDQRAPTQPVNERQKKLAADTDKLLALATDLKKQVDKTNKDILSVDVVKKAEEIEKLARSMKNDTK